MNSTHPVYIILLQKNSICDFFLLPNVITEVPPKNLNKNFVISKNHFNYIWEKRRFMNAKNPNIFFAGRLFS